MGMLGDLVLSFCMLARGAGVAMWAILIEARRMMVVEHESRYSFDETAECINRVLEETDGWGSPVETWRFSNLMGKRGEPFDKIVRMHVFSICKAIYAKRMIDAIPEMASIMRCGVALYERDGRTSVR